MSKNGVSPVPNEGKQGADDEDAGRNVRQLSSSDTIKKVPYVPKYPKTMSKATRSIQPIINFVISRLSLGQPVSEQDVYENSQSRYRRSESLMILREVHRRYRRQTALVLRRDGQWMLLPIPPRRMP